MTAPGTPSGAPSGSAAQSQTHTATRPARLAQLERAVHDFRGSFAAHADAGGAVRAYVHAGLAIIDNTKSVYFGAHPPKQIYFVEDLPVDATSPTHEMLFQRNQTNLELLGELAERIGFEVFASDGKLYFRAPKTGGAPAKKLKKGEAMLAFRPRVRAALMPTEVGFLDWDCSKPQPTDGSAKKDDAGPIMGGKTAATAVAEKLGTAKQLLRGVHVEAKPEADTIAKAVLQKATQNLVHADASLTGSADIRPGQVVDIDGVGDIFSGPYYVNRVVHNFLKQGFTTTLGLRRSSLEKAPAPPPPMPAVPPRPPAVPGQLILARLVDQATQQPLSNQPYDVLDPSGKVFETGRTDWQGNVQHRVPASGQYTVRARVDTAGGGAGGGPPARTERPPRSTPQHEEGTANGMGVVRTMVPASGHYTERLKRDGGTPPGAGTPSQAAGATRPDQTSTPPRDQPATGSFLFHLGIDPDNHDAIDDVVTLTGPDGYSKTLGIVAEGQKHAHQQGATTLVFEGVKVGGKYTCTVDPKGGARP